MKKIWFAGAGLLLFAAGVQAENKMTMITYFPVPYVAYSKVNVRKAMDVGLTNACAMNLGCAESRMANLPSLSAKDIYLRQGRLELNTARAAESNTITLGGGYDEAEINFDSNLRIGTLNDGYSLETDQMTLDVLKLFPEEIANEFPSCASTGAEGAPQISWQPLKLKDVEETYLVCGTPKEIQDCTNSSYKATHKSICCPGTPETDSVCWRTAWVYTGETEITTRETTLSTRNSAGSHEHGRYSLWCHNDFISNKFCLQEDASTEQALASNNDTPFCRTTGDLGCVAGKEYTISDDNLSCTAQICATGQACDEHNSGQPDKEYWVAHFMVYTRTCAKERKAVPNGW